MNRLAPKASFRSIQRRWASHGPHYNEPSGYLFAEKAPKAGEKRVKEDWENIYYIGMFGGMALGAVLQLYRPDTTVQTWATEEAKQRLAERGELPKYTPSS